MEQRIYDGMVEYATTLHDQLAGGNLSRESMNEAHHQYMDILDQLEKLHKDDMEFFDKEERRRIDDERNQKTAELESEKQRISWKRAALDLSKTIIPVVGSIATVWIGLSFANEIEKDGYVKTKFSQTVLNQIPKIWNGR